MKTIMDLNSTEMAYIICALNTARDYIEPKIETPENEDAIDALNQIEDAIEVCRQIMAGTR